tara:strand:- start:542 stop:1075 length:534 start_codon:yes stop_codon:yes gene_type:complete
MKRKLLLPILCMLISVTFSQKTAAKKPVLLKSTITSVGSSTAFMHENKYTVQQSIGQSGIIGKVKTKNTLIKQGFLSNFLFFSIQNSDVINFEETLNVVISPNPFIDYIKIDFSSKTRYEIQIKIYDINGKTFTYKKYKAAESIIVPMKNFSIGNYIVHIISGENKYVKKILKTNRK